MKPRNFLNCLVLAGLVLGADTRIACRECPALEISDSLAPVRRNLPPDADSAAPRKIRLGKHLRLTGGQLTLPFKIRPKASNDAFRLTTDVTLGGFVGATAQISGEREFYVTVPLTAGLTFINLDNHNTSLDLAASEPGVVPGITWSTGLIFQLGDYTVGLVCGKDYASEVGNQWDYHGKWWWTFAIGYTFLN